MIPYTYNNEYIPSTTVRKKYFIVCLQLALPITLEGETLHTYKFFLTLTFHLLETTLQEIVSKNSSTNETTGWNGMKFLGVSFVFPASKEADFIEFFSFFRIFHRIAFFSIFEIFLEAKNPSITPINVALGSLVLEFLTVLGPQDEA